MSCSPDVRKGLEGSIQNGPGKKINYQDSCPDEFNGQGNSVGPVFSPVEPAVEGNNHVDHVSLACGSQPVGDKPEDVRGFQPGFSLD